MPEPRYASEEWRWVDAEDGTHVLLVGPESMPVPRVVLTCGDIDAEDMDGIRAAPKLYAAGEALMACLTEMGFSGQRMTAMGIALAAARGEGRPDA